ncbi:MAG TPA: TonB family protein [Spirochaetales bacterium]|nr:TonB family protein [Spirochaetales bacterium]
MKWFGGSGSSEDRKRWTQSVFLTVALYGVLGLVAFLTQTMSPPQELVLSNRTVIVNLDGPVKEKSGRGSVYPSDVGEEGETIQLPEPAVTQQKTQVPANAAPKVVAAPQTQAESKPSAKPTTTQANKPAPTPATPPSVANPAQDVRTSPLALVSAVQDEQKTPPGTSQTSTNPPKQEAPTQVEEPWTPSGTRSSKSGQTSANQFLYVPGQGMVPWGEGNSYIVRKAERGSGIETAFGGARGTVGHNIYVPVSDFMPLPSSVPASVFERAIANEKPETASQRKRDFLTYYELKGDTYVIKKEAPLDKRGLIWPLLDAGKYDMSQSEYKKGKNLSPVIIGFTITKDNQLKDVQILQSSGDPELDSAVQYGFTRASFWNKTGDTVPGKFTYYF